MTRLPDAVRPTLLVFDVESVGLHGEGFAWGAVRIRPDETITEYACWCPPDSAQGTDEGRSWVAENIVVPKANVGHPRALRERFWLLWEAVRREDGLLMADVAWPVESRFLADCIADEATQRQWQGPHPLLDAASFRFADLANPTEDVHDPLEDARRTWLSIRDWWWNLG